MHGTSRSKLVPIEHAGRYAIEGLNMYGGTVVLDSRSDVVPGTLYNGEIVFGPSGGMAGPDVAFSFKNAAKELAHQEGLLASFMSKPFADSAGCGAHNHIGLLSRGSGENAMADPAHEWGLSKLGRSFVAGQLRHARAIYTLLAPTVNCMKRRRTHTFSPTNVSWGLEDRSAFVRVKGGDPNSKHVENRAPTGLSNPYLASAGLLGAGLLGIIDELELEPPATPP